MPLFYFSPDDFHESGQSETYSMTLKTGISLRICVDRLECLPRAVRVGKGRKPLPADNHTVHMCR